MSEPHRKQKRRWMRRKIAFYQRKKWSNLMLQWLKRKLSDAQVTTNDNERGINHKRKRRCFSIVSSPHVKDQTPNSRKIVTQHCTNNKTQQQKTNFPAWLSEWGKQQKNSDRHTDKVIKTLGDVSEREKERERFVRMVGGGGEDNKKLSGRRWARTFCLEIQAFRLLKFGLQCS